jgi:diketogulonate reductase-like aldo/keto reductase
MATAISPMLELNNGVEMPALGLGVFQSQPAETVGAVESAIEDGYRLIDTAAAYMNEQEVGEGVRRTGIDRGQIFVTTKLWISDYGYEPALRGFDGCLGDSASTTSTWSCCIIRYRTNSTGRWPRTRPPSRCLLTGGYAIVVSDAGAIKNLLEDPTIVGLAAKYQKTPAQVVLRWHLERGVSAIPKSVKPRRIAENFDVFGLGSRRTARSSPRCWRSPSPRPR